MQITKCGVYWVPAFAGTTLRALWTRKGFAAMAQRLLALCGARANLLGAVAGERRLTNLLHVVELAQQAAAEHHLSPDGLLAWYAHVLGDPKLPRGEYAELRLESDADAVQIVTIAAPTAGPDAPTTLQDVTVTFNPLTNDTAAAPTALDPTSVRLYDTSTSSYGATVTIPGQGTYTVDTTTGLVTFDPLPTFTGVAAPVTPVKKRFGSTYATRESRSRIETNFSVFSPGTETSLRCRALGAV